MPLVNTTSSENFPSTKKPFIISRRTTPISQSSFTNLTKPIKRFIASRKTLKPRLINTPADKYTSERKVKRLALKDEPK